MPRRARLLLPGVPLHIIQRGNNRQPCLFATEDYRLYLEWLTACGAQAGCRVHAYALMTNHVRLLVSGTRQEAPVQLMKALGQRYVQYVNRAYHRSGIVPFRHALAAEAIDAIRSATHGNYALGDERFAQRVSATLGQRTIRGKAGRPRREVDSEPGDLLA